MPGLAAFQSLFSSAVKRATKWQRGCGHTTDRATVAVPKGSEDVMPERIVTHQDGQGLLEYSLILVLVAVVVVVVLAVLGPAVGNVFSNVVDYLTEDPAGDPPPECYGSLLLPIMVAATGLGVGLSSRLPKKTAA